MKTYKLTKAGILLITKAAIAGPDSVKILSLLIDTGSSYTIIPVEVLESCGCSPAGSQKHLRIVTGSGYIIAPAVRLDWISTFGEKMEKFDVVAHTLPFGGPIDGLLGMDILTRIKARIDLENNLIEIP
jgi:aspartyl protease family protein